MDGFFGSGTRTVKEKDTYSQPWSACNVAQTNEIAFCMIKSKFGDKLRSKNLIAQKNELLCKVIAHNIVVLIHEMHELWIYLNFSFGKSVYI